MARRISVHELIDIDLDELLFAEAERLGEIYLAQLDRRDVSQGDQDANEVVSIAKPLRKTQGRQGFKLSAPERRPAEQPAMALAVYYLSAAGYRCVDTSATESFDLLAQKGDTQYKVEVKGTTSDLCYSVIMTKNEVELRRREKGSKALLIVSKIQLTSKSDQPVAQGGEVEAIIGWDINAWTTDAIAFQVSRQL
jgi:Holliday junction resolvase-like predicted endonuclease